MIRYDHLIWERTDGQMHQRQNPTVENGVVLEDTRRAAAAHQMVLPREGGMTQPAIAAAMGVSLSTVNRAHRAFDQAGIKAFKPKPSGGRWRENMTVAEEKALLARFAKAAGAGEMLNIQDLKAAYERGIGHRAGNQQQHGL